MIHTEPALMRPSRPSRPSRQFRISGTRVLAALFLTSATTVLSGVDGITRVKSSGGVTEYRLDSNGLSILFAPVDGCGATTFSVTYRVGSRNESYGTTGATHLLEHMMFKGTATRNKQAGNGMDQLLEGIGAETNATTGLDSTNYITTLSPEHLPVIIGLEADRMRNLRLREEDFRPELSVVCDEYDRGEDDPVMALDREIWATAFQAHPYRHSIIGWRSDIENVPLMELRGFYDTHYWPDRATVTVTGAIADPDTVISKIKDAYGAIPRAPRPAPEVHTVEPPQTGPRRFIMKRAGETGIVTIAYKTPSARHVDFPALLVLCDLLADGQNCRFYQDLTDGGLTTDVTAAVQPTLDPSLLIISAELAGEASHEDVEDGILEIIGEITANGVGDDEVKTSIGRLSAQEVFARDGSQALAETINESIAAGDWSLYQTREREIRNVTAARVREAAKRWLTDDTSTVGWYVADAKAKSGDAPAAVAKSAAGPLEATPLILPDLPPADPSALKIAPRVTRTRTAGIDLLVCPGGSPDIVHLTGSIPAGTPSDQPLASLAVEMIQRGTTAHDSAEIGRLLDESGISLEFTAEGGYIGFTGSCLSKQLPRMLSLLAEQLRQPSFPDDELKAVIPQFVSEARLGQSDPQYLASLALNRAIHPAGDPDRLPDADESIARLGTLRRKDLVDFHKEWFGPAGAVLVIGGDISPSTCQAEVGRSFAGWAGGRKHQDSVPNSIPPAAASINLPIAGKESTTILLGQACGVRFPQEDAIALTLATAALGDGFTSRLLNTIRDTEGLTYHISAGLSIPDTRGGLWTVTGSFAPELAGRGLESTRREILRWHHEGLNEREFVYRRNALLGAHRVELATTAGITNALHACVLRGQPPEWMDESAAHLMNLTRGKVNAAIRRHLDPEHMIEIKCGATRKE